MYKKLFIEKYVKQNPAETPTQPPDNEVLTLQKSTQINPKRLLSIFFPGVLAKQQGSLCTNTKSYSQISTRNRIYRHTHTCKDAEEIQRIILEGRKDFGKVS